jgi:hypothetical protein
MTDSYNCRAIATRPGRVGAPGKAISCTCRPSIARHFYIGRFAVAATGSGILQPRGRMLRSKRRSCRLSWHRPTSSQSTFVAMDSRYAGRSAAECHYEAGVLAHANCGSERQRVVANATMRETSTRE